MEDARHHTVQKLEPWPNYEGPVSHLSADEARAMLNELMDYFGLGRIEHLPEPPMAGSLERPNTTDSFPSTAWLANGLLATPIFSQRSKG
ncbi:hypothetical protein [Sphingomonas sp. SRS2]|uniref:hypothetical protein n=1 Tax=Sphingomonas sp. SRS2 TaxID=133190 RepID=UPI0006184EE2|nr:hypothetical protein [Sphingomonas sp. SRS2]KKC27324.1 hypothetical protein WP12_04040 [Sphingomonas sp. SRS2]